MAPLLGVNMDIPEAGLAAMAVAVICGIAWMIRQQSVIREYIREAAGVRESHLVEIGGQPVEVKGPKEYVERSGYHQHCELNRKEHARIEREWRETMEQIRALHHALAREVSEINARSETNESRLIQMDAKLDQIRFQQTRKP